MSIAEEVDNTINVGWDLQEQQKVKGRRAKQNTDTLDPILCQSHNDTHIP